MDFVNDKNNELNFSQIYPVSRALEDGWLEATIKNALQDLEGLEVFEEKLKKLAVFDQTSSIDPDTLEIVLK